MTTAYVNKIATAVPEHDVHEKFVEFAVGGFDKEKDKLIFRRMVERSHIAHRWAQMRDMDEFYGGDPNSVGIEPRMKEFEKVAPRLAIDTVNKLDLGDQAAQITHIVVVTCTGFYTPGLDYDIIHECGLNTSVERTQVAFMGCYAGVNGLKVAHHIVRSEPDAKVLLVALELCSLHLQGAKPIDTMLSYLIFSDGCAAALITAEETGLAIDSFKAVMIPETRNLMTLGIGEISVQMYLSGQVPGTLQKALSDDATVKLILNGAEKAEMDLWAIHPGGRSILDSVAQALGLGGDELAISRHVLNNYGNMASATILFVLEEIMSRNCDGELAGATGCALGFGPGLAAESMLFRLAQE
ncbi:type III polyketide synthase [Mycobacterium sp. CBMA271]|uniref:type III polyketide synthase n=1 Tax=unclassified Mycobacteroides TaxID=2618759 RepID=UPI0012DE8612|nr:MULTISPECIES: type III polyketide synthase [unclassified Mycobacteroides]MUM17238.1 stilbene synthase [Mycobacteroides sp. CBMA 326]MUM23931.1 type III polyketide synthase [Mycobacteroides sp. CBMA 271]